VEISCVKKIKEPVSPGSFSFLPGPCGRRCSVLVGSDVVGPAHWPGSIIEVVGRCALAGAGVDRRAARTQVVIARAIRHVVDELRRARATSAMARSGRQIPIRRLSSHQVIQVLVAGRRVGAVDSGVVVVVDDVVGDCGVGSASADPDATVAIGKYRVVGDAVAGAVGTHVDAEAHRLVNDVVSHPDVLHRGVDTLDVNAGVIARIADMADDVADDVDVGSRGAVGVDSGSTGIAITVDDGRRPGQIVHPVAEQSDVGSVVEQPNAAGSARRLGDVEALDSDVAARIQPAGVDGGIGHDLGSPAALGDEADRLRRGSAVGGPDRTGDVVGTGTDMHLGAGSGRTRCLLDARPGMTGRATVAVAAVGRDIVIAGCGGGRTQADAAARTGAGIIRAYRRDRDIGTRWTSWCRVEATG